MLRGTLLDRNRPANLLSLDLFRYLLAIYLAPLMAIYAGTGIWGPKTALGLLNAFVWTRDFRSACLKFDKFIFIVEG